MATKYEQLAEPLNCVLFALAETFQVSRDKMGRYLVDNNIGGLTKLTQLDNPGQIKKVMSKLGLKCITKADDDWQNLQTAELKKHTLADKKRRFMGFYWRKSQKEDFNEDTSIVSTRGPVYSDHAFCLELASNGTFVILPTNETKGFDVKKIQKPTDRVSLFVRDTKLPAINFG